MVAGGLRRGRRRTDDLDRGPVADQLFRVPRVTPPEADDICASLAEVHQAALRSGMALGALDGPRCPRALLRGRGPGRQLMAAVEAAARQGGVTLLWLTTMPNYSRRPDGTLWRGAFYFKELSA